MADIDDEAERTVDAALNGDPTALKEVVEALEAESDDADDEPESEHPAERLTVERHANQTADRALAATVLRPTVQAAITARRLARYSNLLEADVELDALVSELVEQTNAVNSGKVDRGTAMLASQAHTLDGLYNALLRKAFNQTGLPQFEAFLRFAMRAQSQCRATWDNLGHSESADRGLRRPGQHCSRPAASE